MIIYFSAPKKERREIKVINECLVREIDVPDLQIQSLESIVATSEIVDVLEKRLCILLTGLFQSYKKSFYEDYINSNIPNTSQEFESFLYKTDWDSSYTNSTSIESLVKVLDKEFSLIERAYQLETDEYSKLHKRSTIMKKKTEGALDEIALNVLVDSRQESEFLGEFFVIIEILNDSNFHELIKSNETISYASLAVVAEDENFIIYKFFGLKSAEVQINKFLKENEIKIKRFEDTSEFKQSSSELCDSEDFVNRYKVFLESYLMISMKLYSSMKLFKLYLESLLIYGLPSTYNFYAIITNKSKALIGSLVEFGENEGLRNVSYNNIRNLLEVKESVMIDFAMIKCQFELFED